MSAVTEPAVRPSRPKGPLSAREALDALLSGACDEEAFMGTMNRIFHDTPDASWEVLSLLDQDYRRGKIDSKVFHALKGRVQDVIFGSDHAQFSVPLLQRPQNPAAATHRPGPAVETSTPAADSTPADEYPTVAVGAAPRPATIAGPRPTIAAARPAAAAVAPQPPRATPTPSVGDVLRGRYRIQSVLGKGGMGTVFEAIDEFRLGLPASGQRLAIKVLHSEITGRPDVLDELRNEFQHLQSLTHPNIVRVHEFDRDGEVTFFTMELLSGTLLGRLLGAERRRPLGRADSLAIIRDVGAALAHAQSRGVVHGDIKPHNIFITDEGDVRVLDFGAAHALVRGPWISDFESPVRFPSATPAFASCQVLEGGRPDARDDVYSFSCVAYMLLTGKHPFEELSAVEARARRMTPVRPRGLTRAQWQTLCRGLKWDRLARPSDVSTWLARFDLRAASPRLPRLAALRAPAPPPRPRSVRFFLGVGAALLAVTLLAGLWLTVAGEVPTRAGPTFDSVATAALANARSALTQLREGARRVAGSINAVRGSPDEAGIADRPVAAGPPPAVAATGVAPTPALPGTGTAAAPVVAPYSAMPTAAPAPPAARADAAHARVEIAADLVEVSAAEPLARVTVRRRGNLHGDVRFKWWTEPGSARAGDDFVSVEPRTEHIPDGKDGVKLLVPVVSDLTRRVAKDFYITIGEPGPGTSLGGRTRAMVIIPAGN